MSRRKEIASGSASVEHADRRPARERTLAFCISPHGFGHAARACAIMQAMWALDPALRFVVFTAVPRWFFVDSLQQPFRYQRMATDLGLVQRSALVEDAEATAKLLQSRQQRQEVRALALARRLRALGVDALLADISPIGLQAAHLAGLPSVLIESFTWDWIYRAYPPLHPWVSVLEQQFALADLRIQTEPCCQPRTDARRFAPVSRRPRNSRSSTRRALGIGERDPMVLVTMGGIPWTYEDLIGVESRREQRLGSQRPWLVIPGAGKVRTGRVLGLDHHTPIYHPDLVHAADAVLAKLGYSTLAEVHAAGLPIGYVPRPEFPESTVLEKWTREHLSCRRVTPGELAGEGWSEAASSLVRLASRQPAGCEGATQLAGYLLAQLPGLIGLGDAAPPEARRPGNGD